MKLRQNSVERRRRVYFEHESNLVRSISPISDEDSGAPSAKRSKMIDVVTVDQSPIVSQQRNVFSIRNLIYSKDTSDSDTDNHSEDSGNAPSASNGSSPPRPWTPDQENVKIILKKIFGSYIKKIV